MAALGQAQPRARRPGCRTSLRTATTQPPNSAPARPSSLMSGTSGVPDRPGRQRVIISEHAACRRRALAHRTPPPRKSNRPSAETNRGVSRLQLQWACTSGARRAIASGTDNSSSACNVSGRSKNLACFIYRQTAVRKESIRRPAGSSTNGAERSDSFASGSPGRTPLWAPPISQHGKASVSELWQLRARPLLESPSASGRFYFTEGADEASPPSSAARTA